MTSLGIRRNLDGYWDASLDLLRHVTARTEAELARHREAEQVRSVPGARAYQQQVSAAVARGIGGLLPLPDEPPQADFRDPPAPGAVQRLVFPSLPSVPVPALLYRPAAVGHGAAPAVLFVSGHAPLAQAEPEYQRVCLALADAGFVVLAIDPWGQGERLGYLDPEGRPLVPGGTAEHTYAGLQAWAWGSSAARYFVHDARRAIDLLASLPEVDSTRIGVTGNSGGGTLCTLLAAVEPRVAAAAIGTFVTSRGAYLGSGQRQDAEQVILGGTRAGVDHADLVAAMAPRPVAVLAAEYDFFPIEGTIASVERARRVFEVLGAPEALRLVRAPVAHRYAPELAAAAVAFFAEALDAPGTHRPRASAARPGPEREVADPVTLRCTRTGQVALDQPAAPFLHDLVVGEAADAPQPHQDPATWLAERVFRGRRCPAEPHARWLPGPESTRHGLWRSEEDIWGAGVLLPTAPADGDEEAVSLHLVLHPEGTTGLTSQRAAEIGTAAIAATTSESNTTGGATTPLVLVLDVRGSGALAVHDKDDLPPTDQAGALYKLLTDLLSLDDSLAAGRFYDITRALDMLLTDPALRAEHPSLGPGTAVVLHGYGVTGYAAMAAAVLDPRVSQVHTYGEASSVQALLTERYYDRGDGAWQWLIPGMATAASPARLATTLGRRLSAHL